MNSSNDPSHLDSIDLKKDLVEIDHAPAPLESLQAQGFFRPVPLWFLTLSMVLLFWAGLYLAFYSGGFKAEVFNPDVVSWSGGGAGGVAAPVDLKVIGKKVFSQTCVICHQETGLGVPGQFPPLVGTEWVLSQDWHGDNHLVKQVLYGMQGPITVKNMPFNNAMAPWNQLSDQQIAGVLTYIRSSWGNDAPPITPEFVAKVRADTKPRSEPWTMAELKACPKEMCSASSAAPVPAK
ncbi:MAG: cytochrome c [Chthoniobacterales bacterium]|nr:cytochrome c [Chthoniobacterales bacterium]